MPLVSMGSLGSRLRRARLSFDALVNIGILATCALVVSALTGHWPAHTMAAAVARPAAFERGTAAESLPGVRYDDVQATLVLYVRSTCRFCTASMPFYQKLSGQPGVHRAVRMVVASPESVETSAAYLQAHELRVDQLVSFQGRATGTPTLLLVDRRGLIQQVWLGQQDTRGEQEIVESISHAAGPSS
jgi:hypothetical protein